MNVIVPVALTDAEFVSSNVSEAEYSAWDSGTTYAEGDRVRKSETVWESALNGNINNNPTDDILEQYWLMVGATNRWKIVDGRLSDSTTNFGTVQHRFDIPKLADSVAFLGLNATTVRVIIRDNLGATVFDETKDLVDDSVINNWWNYVTYEGEYATAVIFEGIPGFPTNSIEWIIGDGTAEVQVAEVVFGRSIRLGETLAGSELGFRDFSTKDQTIFGDTVITERPYSTQIDFQVAIPFGDQARVFSVLATIRATPSFFYAGADVAYLGLNVFGFLKDFRVPLQESGFSFCAVEIEGLT